MSEGVMWYLGVLPCGCAPFACAVDRASEDPKMIAAAIESGMRIECVPVEIARRRLKRCGHGGAQKELVLK